jgi:hypothetical protein
MLRIPVIDPVNVSFLASELAALTLTACDSWECF